MIWRYALIGPGLCGRGIRLRELSAPECDKNTLEAIQNIQADAKAIELRQLQLRQGVMKSLVAVTKRDGLKTFREVAELPEKEWQPLTYQMLETGADWNYLKLFGRAKDHDALVQIWQDLHTVDGRLFEQLKGEACPVAIEDSPPATGTPTGAGG